MRLSVKEVELKIREHEKSKYFFWSICEKYELYNKHNSAMCIT